MEDACSGAINVRISTANSALWLVTGIASKTTMWIAWSPASRKQNRYWNFYLLFFTVHRKKCALRKLYCNRILALLWWSLFLSLLSSLSLSIRKSLLKSSPFLGKNAMRSLAISTSSSCRWVGCGRLSCRRLSCSRRLSRTSNVIWRRSAAKSAISNSTSALKRKLYNRHWISSHYLHPTPPCSQRTSHSAPQQCEQSPVGGGVVGAFVVVVVWTRIYPKTAKQNHTFWVPVTSSPSLRKAWEHSEISASAATPSALCQSRDSRTERRHDSTNPSSSSSRFTYSSSFPSASARSGSDSFNQIYLKRCEFPLLPGRRYRLSISTKRFCKFLRAQHAFHIHSCIDDQPSLTSNHNFPFSKN